MKGFGVSSNKWLDMRCQSCHKRITVKAEVSVSVTAVDEETELILDNFYTPGNIIPEVRCKECKNKLFASLCGDRRLLNAIEMLNPDVRFQAAYHNAKFDSSFDIENGKITHSITYPKLSVAIEQERRAQLKIFFQLYQRKKGDNCFIWYQDNPEAEFDIVIQTHNFNKKFKSMEIGPGRFAKYAETLFDEECHDFAMLIENPTEALK